MKSFAPRPGGLTAGSSHIRDDVEAPVLALCSETETMHNYVVRQPDTDTFRFWEMAGAAHAGADESAAQIFESLYLRSAVDESLVLNTVKWDYMADAALRHLVDWVERGVAPPRFPPIDVDPGSSPSIRRDEWGNATGGIRLPEVVAATATNRGENTANPVASLFGETIPFSDDVLRSRYANRSAYLAAWNGAVDDLVASGLDIGRDVEALRDRGVRIARELNLP
jgi:hypothetical protein